MTKRDMGIHLITALVIFAQGLYFDEQWLVALVAVTVLLAVKVWRSGEIRWRRDLMSCFLVANVLLNLLGYLWYLEKGMLVFGLLKSCLYLFFYLLLIQYEEAVAAVIRKAFVRSMALAGCVTAIAFITGGFGHLQYVIDNRAAGPVQYANTFGILLVTALLLLVSMDMGMLERSILSLCLTVPLMLTMSRANYLVAAVMLLSALVFLKVKKATFVPVISSVLVGVLVLRLFDDSDTAVRLTEAAGASEWHSRLLYYTDAVKMILDRPMGFGHNGYHYAQSFYQTGSTYHVKFVHSGLIQAFLDRGIIGGSVMIVFMFCSVFLGRHTMTQRLVMTAVLGHSLIDMNLQFPVVWLLLIAVMASDKAYLSIRVKKAWMVWVPAVGTVWLVVFMLQPVMAYSDGDYETAIQKYPGYTEAYRKLLKETGDDPAQVAYAQALADRNPYVTEAYETLAAAAKSEDDYDLALDWYRRQVHYSPLLIEHHESLSHGLMLAATYWHAFGEDDKAVTALKEILQMPEAIGQLAKGRHTDYNVKHKPDLRMTSALMKDYEEAAWLMSVIEAD